MPPWLQTVLISVAPIVELRGGLPWGLASGLPWWQAYTFAVIGNLLPIIPLLLWLDPVSEWMRKKWRWADRFFSWIFARTRRRGTIVEKYEALGLLLFVAIPLPVTGAWTGAAAAFIFGIRNRYAFPAVIGGVLLAGVIVSLAYYGVIGAADLFTGGY